MAGGEGLLETALLSNSNAAVATRQTFDRAGGTPEAAERARSHRRCPRAPGRPRADRPLRPDDPRGPHTQGDQLLAPSPSLAPGCPAIWAAHLGEQHHLQPRAWDVPTDGRPSPRLPLLSPSSRLPPTRVQASTLPPDPPNLNPAPSQGDLCSGQPEPSS